jgi:lipid-binding SYLF domain-containing protein
MICKIYSRYILAFLLIMTAGLSLNGFQALADESVEEKREEVRKMAAETLAKLYELQPSAKTAIEQSAGYAVFSNFGLKILVLGSGKGEGIVVNKQTGKETFMKMLELQAGLGLGVKRFGVVFVFENEGVLNKFINSGWEFGGQSTVAAKLDEEGGAFTGAATVSPGVWVYQITKDGLAVELTVKGTKYMKNDKLN